LCTISGSCVCVFNLRHFVLRHTKAGMPRLTSDLVYNSPQFVNALRERELDLRGNSIPAIENLGVCKDQFDTIDFTDNEIRKLENFPRMTRLKTLLLSNNKVMRASRDIGKALPNVSTIILMHNLLQNLSDIDAFNALPRLEKLDLRENGVTKQDNYRLYVIARLPNLKWLDYAKVKPAEREEAKKMFGDEMAKKDEVLKAQPLAKDKQEQQGPSPQQVAQIKAAIAKAQTLEEVEKLEGMLLEGKIPAQANGH